MEKKIWAGLSSGIVIFCMAGGATATSLLSIGTATYNGTNYDLIWEASNNGNSVVWLDYTNGPNTWENQNAWAASLDGLLTYNLNPGYNVNWSGSWRLPSTVDGEYEFGLSGTTTGGFNITSSEMGELYYTEFGYTYDNPEQVANNTFFNNLVGVQDSFYWSATGYLAGTTDLAWQFTMYNGDQNAWFNYTNNLGLAVRTGQVLSSTASPVPEPATMLLLGAGIVGLAGINLRRKKK